MIIRLHADKLVLPAIICSCVLALVGYTSAIRGAELQKPQLAVAAEPQGMAKDLQYKVETPDLVALFFVRNTGDVDAKGLRLSARLHETNQARGSTVLRLSSEGKRLDDGSLTMLPGEAMAVELKASGLPIGMSSGYLLVEQGDSKFTLATLSFEYNVAPLVKVVGLADGSELQATTFGGTYEHVLSVQSQNDTPIEELQATITPVTGPDGVQRSGTIELVSSGKMPAALKGHSIVDLRLKTVLPTAGIYKGTINLSYDAHAKEVPFSITRAKMPLPYEILAPEAARAYVGFGQDDTRIRITLHELNGVDLKSQKLPELATLNTVVTGQKSYQTKFSGMSWQDEAGQTVSALSLTPGGSHPLWLVVSGLNAAGEHSGSLRLSLPDGQTVTQAISIITRKHVGYVVFFVVLGIGLSQALKLLGSRALNIQEQQQLSRIDNNVGRLLVSPEATVEGRYLLEHLRARILIVYADSQANRGRSYAAEIGELDCKVRMTPRWAVAAEAARAIRPPATDLLTQVKQLKQFLLAENSSDQDLAAKESLLTTLKNDIDAKSLNLVTDAIRVLSQQIARYEELQPLPAESRSRLQAVKSLIRSAEDAVTRTEPKSARELYDRASRDYASSLVQDSSERIKNPPAVFAQEIRTDRWAATAARLSGELDQIRNLLPDDPNAAMRRIWTVRASYWSESLRLARSSVQGQIQPDQDPAQPGLAALNARLEAIIGFAGLLAGLENATEINPEELLGFERKIENLNEPEGARNLALAGVVAVAASGGVQLLAGLPDVQLLPKADADSIRLANVNALQSRRWWNEGLIMLLSGVVAVVVGLKLLWIDNIVWGTPGDYLIATLWGLGLHQVANATFDFNSFVSRLTKPPG